MKITLTEQTTKKTEVEIASFPFYLANGYVRLRVEKDRFISLSGGDGEIEIEVHPVYLRNDEIVFSGYVPSDVIICDSTGFESLLRELKDMVLSG